ncbi:uncharacterized protein LOC143579055 [Bidens hawaiensis]|uniref:uncharacterized protein LOC143579055 n=1 Tax=Bidens hawaiensis TaxID=980011 RepID=UPI00404B8CAF
MLRTDRGGEFTSSEFHQFCKDNGIARQLTAPYSPQQNGVVERRNRTMLSTTRSIMKAMSMPQNFWGEAVRHTIYVLNRIPTKALTNTTPFEALKGRKPNLKHLRVFGCVAYAKVPSNHLTKLDDRSVKMVYLGVEEGSKAYRLYDPNTKRICISRDVKFLEKDSWNWEEYMNEVGSEEPEWVDFIVEDNFNEVTQENNETVPVTREDEYTRDNDQEYEEPLSPNSPSTPVTPSTYTYEPNSAEVAEYRPIIDSSLNPFDHTPLKGFKPLGDVYKRSKKVNTDVNELFLVEEEPHNYKEAANEKKWIEVMQAEIDSINKNNTWKLTKLPDNHKAIGLK